MTSVRFLLHGLVQHNLRYHTFSSLMNTYHFLKSVEPHFIISLGGPNLLREYLLLKRIVIQVTRMLNLQTLHTWCRYFYKFLTNNPEWRAGVELANNLFRLLTMNSVLHNVQHCIIFWCKHCVILLVEVTAKELVFLKRKSIQDKKKLSDCTNNKLLI